jgi:S1-C subfamily serine protease
MKKYLWLLLLGLATPVHASVEESIVELRITRTEEPTEMETALQPKVEEFGSKALCSGVFVGKTGEILTAKHCTEDAEEIIVLMSDGSRYKATVATTSAKQDLALLLIDRRDTPFLVLGSSVTRGESISALGSPLGITGVRTQGTIARIDGDLYFLDCGVLPGNSGGPVINTKNELVGIAVAGLIVGMGTTHLNIAQGVDSIFFFLNGRKK